MRRLLGFAMLFISLDLLAQVGNPYSSRCQVSVSFDSYGRGIESAFLGEDLRMRFHDEVCYQLGIKAATVALGKGSLSSCRRSFARGHSKGLVAQVYAEEECFNLGVSAGLAALGSAAREGHSGVAGVQCVNAYQQGRKDGKRNAPQNSRTSNAVSSYCYQLGHFEASLFP